MANYPIPKNAKKVKQFMSLCNYYRRFVKGYSEIAAPLFKLLSKENDKCFTSGADLGGGSRGSGPPLSYMKNDVMRTVICAAFCMFPSLDLQHCPSF